MFSVGALVLFIFGEHETYRSLSICFGVTCPTHACIFENLHFHSAYIKPKIRTLFSKTYHK